jgi:hypothetical protein
MGGEIFLIFFWGSSLLFKNVKWILARLLEPWVRSGVTKGAEGLRGKRTNISWQQQKLNVTEILCKWEIHLLFWDALFTRFDKHGQSCQTEYLGLNSLEERCHKWLVLYSNRIIRAVNYVYQSFSAHSNSALTKSLSSRSHIHKYIQDVRGNTGCTSIYSVRTYTGCLGIYRVFGYIQSVRIYTRCPRIYRVYEHIQCVHVYEYIQGVDYIQCLSIYRCVREYTGCTSIYRVSEYIQSAPVCTGVRVYTGNPRIYRVSEYIRVSEHIQVFEYI